MGMFDYISHKATCAGCGAILTEFQSKDGPCKLLTLKPKHVDYFYSYCPECNKCNDFIVERKCKVKSIKQE